MQVQFWQNSIFGWKINLHSGHVGNLLHNSILKRQPLCGKIEWWENQIRHLIMIFNSSGKLFCLNLFWIFLHKETLWKFSFANLHTYVKNIFFKNNFDKNKVHGTGFLRYFCKYDFDRIRFLDGELICRVDMLVICYTTAFWKGNLRKLKNTFINDFLIFSDQFFAWLPLNLLIISIAHFIVSRIHDFCFELQKYKYPIRTSICSHKENLWKLRFVNLCQEHGMYIFSRTTFTK